MQAVLFFIGIVVLLIIASGLFQIGFALIVPLFFWMLAGMIAGRMLRGRGYGPVADILLGLVGGLVGSFVLRLIGMAWVGNIWLIGNIIVGVIGALLLVWVVRVIADKNFAR